MTTRRRGVERERREILKRMLEERRREIQEKLRSLRETAPAEAEVVRDAEEQSVDDFVKDVDFALMEMKSETLRKIDEAVQRLEAGHYGRCADCDTEIAEARLKALPFADRCRGCQERLELQAEEQHETKGSDGHFGQGPFERDA